MRWGKTYAERAAKKRKGYIRFALLPHKLENGRWLWLECFRIRWEPFKYHHGGYWVYEEVEA